jgi:predicted ATPase
VARKGLNLLLVLSTRPLEEYFETIPRELISLREMGTTIEMEPLTADESLELCRWHIGPPPLPAHDALQPHASGEILVQKSGGNPLFVRNIAISLKEEAERGNIVNLQDLPTGFFNDLIVSRFDALEPMEQTVLKAASVIGTTFSMKLVLHMLPDTSRDKRGLLHAALIKLIGGNFISRTVVGKTERFNFVHGAVQETIYRMMLVDQREALHEVCAAWYEQHYRNSMTYTSLITHHWLRSANTSKKVERLLRAANHAKATFSHEETIKHFSALVALAFARPPSISSIFSLRR